MIIPLIGSVLLGVANFLEYLLIGYIILGWFIFFGAVKDRDGVFFRVYVFLMTKIEPLLSVIRRFLPSLGGLDFSPLVVFLALHFVKVLVVEIVLALTYG